jgi:2'-5' RNA ligase
MKSVARARLFIALWPSAEVQDALFAQGARFAALGRRVPARNLHVTLAFLGQLDASRIGTLTALLRDCNPEQCTLKLDRPGYFANARALWAGSTQVPSQIGAYQQRLTDALDAAGLRTERRVLRPHVTLLRDAVKPPVADLQAGFSIPWQVRGVALVRSDLSAAGARYTVLSGAG